MSLDLYAAKLATGYDNVSRTGQRLSQQIYWRTSRVRVFARIQIPPFSELTARNASEWQCFLQCATLQIETQKQSSQARLGKMVKYFKMSQAAALKLAGHQS